MAFDFEPSIILETAPQLLGGMKLTLIITLGGLLVGLLLGIITGLVNTSRSRLFRGIAIIYIETIRGTPLIVQVMFLYFGLPLALGMRIPPDVAGVIAIGVNSGAYIAEIVRGAIESIDKGQTEAARSLGLSSWQSMRLVVLPQAIKNVLPALANEVVTMVKESSICSVLGMAEIMYTAQTVSGNSYITLAPYVLAALVYFCINYPASKAIEAIERRMRRGDKQ